VPANLLKRLSKYYGLDTLFKSSSLSQSSSSTDPRTQQLEALRSAYTYSPDLTEEHLSIIKELQQEEANRLSAIETKLSQVITQAGVIFALSSFIAPVFGDNLNELSLVYKLLLILVFLLSFLAYLIAILIASRVFAVHQFIYRRTRAASVIDLPNTKKELIAKQVKDLIYQLNHNKEVNNQKASLLIHANRWFVLGFLLSGVLSFSICCLLLFISNLDHKQEELSANVQKLNLDVQGATNSLTQLSTNIQKEVDSNKSVIYLHEWKKLKVEIDSLREKTHLLQRSIKLNQ
jgi:hypothetical protein